ncbi:carboxypeptidase-like regulatory domain-containing protein [Hymenobacter persicinus]|uniref:carboxypeptidase-like regulatory domain-containing protein n=1 Tax=Hymenobacter persicinus TaxID=2025506 RepID=UPI0013EDC88F|nr:carboxypeptidase-like regulatory domain-containing protein [Hymenobacter persicinus]
MLPSYRDAYLRGDLTLKNAELVDAYLKANPAQGDETLQRFYAMQTKGDNVKPVGWIQQQFHLMRTEPVRFRRRAGSIILVGSLLSGALLAGNSRPATLPTDLPATSPTTLTNDNVVASAEASGTAATAASTMSVIKGRILDENGHPLVGATVIDKVSGRGISTNAQGAYTLLVPANQTSRLQYGYGGYSEEEIQVKGRSTQNVTLLPRTDAPAKTKKRHWRLF